MIALDTNVLVRYLVRDDIEQAEAARSLLESLSVDRPGYVCREVTATAERVGAHPLYTFDQKAARLEGATLVMNKAD